MTTLKKGPAYLAVETPELEITIRRTLNVFRDLAFSAWTEPRHLEHWQNAPRGFTVTHHDVDFRAGGAYRICMRSPEGVEHWLEGAYREIARPERLVFTHSWLDAQGRPGKETLVTVSFFDRGGKTELILHQTGFASAASRDGHQDGWSSSIDRFEEYLATL